MHEGEPISFIQQIEQDVISRLEKGDGPYWTSSQRMFW
jgi:hypothetical protein